VGKAPPDERDRATRALPSIASPGSRPDPGPASAGNLQAFRLLSSDDGRLNERPAERARLDGLQQTGAQLLPS
jgi:hypothetical protein